MLTPVILAWKIPWTEEPGRLQSRGSQRVGAHRLIEFMVIFSRFFWEWLNIHSLFCKKKGDWFGFCLICDICIISSATDSTNVVQLGIPGWSSRVCTQIGSLLLGSHSEGLIPVTIAILQICFCSICSGTFDFCLSPWNWLLKFICFLHLFSWTRKLNWEDSTTKCLTCFKICLERDCHFFGILKLNIQKTKIMASGPITSWQIDGETVETVADFIFLGSKITADCDCNHEIKRHLLLGIKAMTNLDSILKRRDITLPTKVHLVKAMVFPVVMYGYESWTIKKAEYWRIDAFELWCWRRLLRVPWTARRSIQSILKRSVLGVHWKNWCWSWSSNTLATWCEVLTHWKRPWCWERLKAGREGDEEDEIVGWHH